jgi:ERCC4-type nuclease
MATTSHPITFDLNGLRVPRDKQPQASGASGGSGDPFRRLAVCPFRIVVDSREQLPYGFSGLTGPAGEGLVVPTLVKGLPSGDYSIEGLEDRVAVERKSLDDLYGSVTWGRERFEREIERLAELPGFACVVIEATWPEIVAPAEHRPGWENRTDPRSVEGTIVAWSLRYPRVHWWPCGDRRGAFSVLRKFWDAQQKQSR